MLSIKLNDEQVNAIEAMKEFVQPDNDEQFLVLIGPAGSGKTTCMKELVAVLGGRIAFTAPTNKATRVLRDILTTTEYTPETCTIYNLLGLRLEPSGKSGY